MTLKPQTGFGSMKPLIQKFSRKPKINLGAGGMQDCMLQRDQKRKKRVLSLSIQIEMTKYRVFPRTVSSTV